MNGGIQMHDYWGSSMCVNLMPSSQKNATNDTFRQRNDCTSLKLKKFPQGTQAWAEVLILLIWVEGSGCSQVQGE